MSLDCLNNVIGLSKSTCDCWDADKPVDFDTLNASSSGLYISQPNTITLRYTNSASDCENGGIWQLLLQAREDAVRDLVSDFLAATSQVKEERFLPFTTIGDDYYKRGEIVNGNVAGVWLEPYEIRGGKLRIESVDITFWDGIVGATNVDISIYSSLDLTTPLATATANVTANKTTATATFATPFIKDLGDIRQDLNERLYILYTIPVGATPVANSTEKGCGCNKTGHYRDNPYLQILTLGGVQGSSVATIDTNVASSGGTMNGLVLNSSLECDYYSWLCELAQTPGQSTNISGQRLKLGMALADGLQAKAIYNLAHSILNSGRINYYSMVLEAEYYYKIANHYIKIYKSAIENLVYYMPADVSDCLICANDKRMNKGSILV